MPVYKCSKCGHVFSIITEEKTEDYNTSYYLEAHKNWFAHPNYKLFEKVLLGIKRGFKNESVNILDVGCGRGDFLTYIHNNAPNIHGYGIDITSSPSHVDFIRGNFLTHSFDRKFDAIVSFMTIEHVDDPSAFIKKVHSIINNRGLIFIVTINSDGLMYKVARFFKKIGFYMPFYRLYHSHHLQHFTDASLRLFMERNGFEIIKHTSHNFPLSAVDIPTNTVLIRTVLLVAVAVIFAISKCCKCGMNQTIICRKLGSTSFSL